MRFIGQGPKLVDTASLYEKPKVSTLSIQYDAG